VLTTDTAGQLARLLDGLEGSGALTSAWRPAFEAVPRRLFLPDRVWRHTRSGHLLIDRAEDPTAWWELVYADEPVVTQLDDGATGGPGTATSSSSKPSLVARMLNALDVSGGQRVLEAGTCTGWNAALLAYRLGDDQVVTVEVDAELAGRAGSALAKAGRVPRAVCADAATGWAPGAPYDRVIATYSVARVPHAWVVQTRPGGRIVVPLHRDIWSGALAVLDVQDGQTAHGRFASRALFMPARADRIPTAAVDSATGRSSTTGLNPAHLTGLGFCVYAHVCLPDVTMTYAPEESGVRVWLTGRDGSAATAAPTRGGQIEVWQYGPTDLWNRVHTVWEEYAAAGSPPLEAFGLTATPDAQRVWLHEPGNVIG
jgi:protein-L-isoaspartate O-methyltransferase